MEPFELHFRCYKKFGPTSTITFMEKLHISHLTRTFSIVSCLWLCIDERSLSIMLNCEISFRKDYTKWRFLGHEHVRCAHAGEMRKHLSIHADAIFIQNVLRKLLNVNNKTHILWLMCRKFSFSHLILPRPNLNFMKNCSPRVPLHTSFVEIEIIPFTFRISQPLNWVLLLM